MHHRPYSSTALILISGLLLSAIALLASDPVCNYFQRERLEKLGHAHAERVAKSLNERLELVRQFAIELEGLDEVTPQRFHAAASKITNHPGIFSVEWAPRVAPDERPKVEADMSARTRRPVQVMTYIEGRTVVVGDAEQTHPITFVHPMDENLQGQIGFQRGKWAAFCFANQYRQTPFLSPINRWYHDDRARTAIFVSGSPPSENARESDSLMLTNTVFAALEDRFDASLLSAAKTEVATEDLTTPQYSAHTADGVADRKLHSVVSTPNEYVVRQQIGARLFEFRVTETADARLRPIWIPWFAFFACNALTCVIGLNWFRKESLRLEESNRKLQNEIETRLATQRHLRSMLDFRDQERELVAHDIHDGFVQDVIGAQMFMESILPLISEDQPKLMERATTVAGLLGTAIEEARRTIDYLKPKVVDEVGLIAAIESSVVDDARRYNFETNLFCPSDFPRLPLLVERMLYRMIREAICNARQHSGMDEATLCITFDDDQISIEVGDSGKGFNPENIDSECFGLSGLRHRAELLQGQANIKTSEYGTKVHIVVSRNNEAPAALTNESLLLDA